MKRSILFGTCIIVLLLCIPSYSQTQQLPDYLDPADGWTLNQRAGENYYLSPDRNIWVHVNQAGQGTLMINDLMDGQSPPVVTSVKLDPGRDDLRYSYLSGELTYVDIGQKPNENVYTVYTATSNLRTDVTFSDTNYVPVSQGLPNPSNYIAVADTPADFISAFPPGTQAPESAAVDDIVGGMARDYFYVPPETPEFEEIPELPELVEGVSPEMQALLPPTPSALDPTSAEELIEATWANVKIPENVVINAAYVADIARQINEHRARKAEEIRTTEGDDAAAAYLRNNPPENPAVLSYNMLSIIADQYIVRKPQYSQNLITNRDIAHDVLRQPDTVATGELSSDYFSGGGSLSGTFYSATVNGKTFTVFQTDDGTTFLQTGDGRWAATDNLGESTGHNFAADANKGVSYPVSALMEQGGEEEIVGGEGEEAGVEPGAYCPI